VRFGKTYRSIYGGDQQGQVVPHARFPHGDTGFDLAPGRNAKIDHADVSRPTHRCRIPRPCLVDKWAGKRNGYDQEDP